MNINTKNIKKCFDILKKNGPKKLIQQMKGSNNAYPLTPLEQLSDIRFATGYIDIVLEKGITLDQCLNCLKLVKNKYRVFTFEKMDNQDFEVINDYTFDNVFSLRSFIYIYRNKPCDFEMCFNIHVNQDIELVLKRYLNTLSGMKLLANYNNQYNISLKTSTFFNYYGTNYCSGGAERYVLDLHEVCKNMDLNLNVYQIGEKRFFRKYQGVNVIGLLVKDEPITNNYSYIDKLTKNYIYQTYNNTLLHIYSAFQECYPNHIGPSIGISHGISWDNKINHYEYGRDYFWEKKKKYLDGAFFCDRLISVDTNTANWFQTVDYQLGNRKFHVIPNYVDSNEFVPRKEFLKQQGNIVIVYPRRLCEPRGLYIVLDIVEDILKKYHNVEFHFVGKGTYKDVQAVEDMVNKYPDKIKCYNKSPQDMKDVYRNADISLIPTQYSEGTSLSCLEALASGNLVIATRIGGLTDLIINGFNGYLIEPDSNSLKDCLVQVLDHFDQQADIRKRGLVSVESFRKEAWKEKWKEEIKSFNPKATSKNNDLIEIQLNNIDSISDKTLNIIKKELENGNLVYLRVDEMPDKDVISHGLLQLVDANEEVVSPAKKIYNEKNR